MKVTRWVLRREGGGDPSDLSDERFKRNEVRDLIISFIVLSVAFAISNVRFDVHQFVSILPIVMVGVALGSLVHELGEKFVATKYGYEAEFKAWPL